MKKILLYLFLCLGFTSQAQAQPGDKSEKIEALYIAYMTRELNLTEAEAKTFWPVHASFDAELRNLRAMDNELKRQEAVLTIKKKYEERFNRILGAERTNTFYVKDAEFRKKLVDRLKKMRQNKNQQRSSLRRNGDQR